jgi:hypothetical protein
LRHAAEPDPLGGVNGAPMKRSIPALCAFVVFATGIAMLFQSATDHPEDFSEIWRVAPAFYGVGDSLIGLVVLVSILAPAWLQSRRSEVRWTGGALGVKPPPNAGFVWNPWSLLLVGLCFLALSVVQFSILAIWSVASDLSKWPSALLGIAHLYVVILLFRATRTVLSGPPG